MPVHTENVICPLWSGRCSARHRGVNGARHPIRISRGSEAGISRESSGKEDPLRGPPPLRTVRETLASYGSSLLRTTCGFRLPIAMRLLVAELVHQEGIGGAAAAGCRACDVVCAKRLSVFERLPAHRAFPSLRAG